MPACSDLLEASTLQRLSACCRTCLELRGVCRADHYLLVDTGIQLILGVGRAERLLSPFQCRQEADPSLSWRNLASNPGKASKTEAVLLSDLKDGQRSGTLPCRFRQESLLVQQLRKPRSNSFDVLTL